MAALTWEDLTFSLARHLESMPTDSYFSLYVDDSGRPGFEADLDDHPLYVQFCAFGEQMVRCEVVSNEFLPADRQHSVDDLIAMRLDGWTLPSDEHVHGSPNIHLDVHTDDADRAAAMVMRVFQVVWQVTTADGIITDARHLRGRHAFRVLDAPVDDRTFDPTA